MFPLKESTILNGVTRTKSHIFLARVFIQIEVIFWEESKGQNTKVNQKDGWSKRLVQKGEIDLKGFLDRSRTLSETKLPDKIIIESLFDADLGHSF